jgi:flavin reductase (DIM6/NTAB) family NADH-FMN oxidoreductase RutF
VDPQPHEFDIPIGALAPEGIGQGPVEELLHEELDLGEGADPAIEFRRTLGMFATGVTVVTTQLGESLHGMTANAFMSVSLQPPLVVVSVDRRARMNALLHEGRHFGISVLSEEQEALSDRFAGRPGEPFDPGIVVVRDTPLIEGAVAHLVARVVRSYWGGDHSLFVGQVEYARRTDGRPLLFHGGRYVPWDTPTISALPPERLAPLLAAGEERAYAASDQVLRTGEPGDELLLVLEGTVHVERDGVTLRRFGAGELFGEIAVLDGGPRTADVFADGPARCLAVSRDALRAAIADDPDLAWCMLTVLASRLRAS